MKEDLLTNFIPINRELFEHYLWCEEREYSRFEAWLYLLKEARFEDTKVLDKGKLVTVKRGQFYASIRFMATAFGWSTKKVGNYLQMLETDMMIKRETVKETGQSILTICNYDKYNTIANIKETPKETARKQRGNDEETKSNTVNTDNKEIDTNVSIKKKSIAAKAATKKRKEDFYKTLIPYLEMYDKEMIRAFYDYWSELNKSETKMKFELNKTWELPLRLATWNRNNQIKRKESNHEPEQKADTKFDGLTRVG